MPNRDALITAWLTYQRNWWAFEALNDQIRENPAEAWGTLLALISSAEPELLESIGAGPLEDFVGDHGDAYIAQIEHEASVNPAFRQALGNVWLKPDENGVIERLVKLGCEVIPVNGYPKV
jgi:hypothetical protein